jgi:glycosyltransferase involved in cell wall biosynthesis
MDVHRGRRYIYPIFVALFGLLYCRPQDYDLIELWGGATWLLAVCLHWSGQRPIVHHSNGIEQHRVEVQRQASIEPIQNERWFQCDFSSLYDQGLHAADAIVTVSSYDLPFLRDKKYVSEERLYAISNPLPGRFLGQDVQYDRPNRVGYCGSWIPVKNPSLLRNDLTSFLRAHPSWTFSIVGVGDADVESDFPGDVRDQIEVISFLEREKLIDWYHTLSVFTLPSVYESFGLVTAEAMACGAAVVATNVGFAHDLEHGEEAIILKHSQSPHLKHALESLAADESLRRRVAQNGYERVQDLRWDDAVKRLEAIYQDLI